MNILRIFGRRRPKPAKEFVQPRREIPLAGQNGERIVLPLDLGTERGERITLQILRKSDTQWV